MIHPKGSPEGESRPDTAAGGRAVELRLPADRRSAVRAGPTDLESLILAFLDTAVRGDLDALSPLLEGEAREALRRLVRRHGKVRLSTSLKLKGRRICDCRTERTMELPDGSAECRLRLFVLERGGQIRSCYWLVQARQFSEGRWLVTGFDRLPGSGSLPSLDCARPSPP